MLRLRIDRPRRATDRVQDDAPEPLRIMLVAVHGYERDAATAGRAVSPRAQQRGLPTSRRRRDDGHPLGHCAIQRLEKVIPVQQAPGDRNVSRDRLLRVQPVLLCRPAGHALPTVQYFDPGYAPRCAPRRRPDGACVGEEVGGHLERQWLQLAARSREWAIELRRTSPAANRSYSECAGALTIPRPRRPARSWPAPAGFRRGGCTAAAAR